MDQKTIKSKQKNSSRFYFISFPYIHVGANLIEIISSAIALSGDVLIFPFLEFVIRGHVNPIELTKDGIR